MHKNRRNLTDTPGKIQMYGSMKTKFINVFAKPVIERKRIYLFTYLFIYLFTNVQSVKLNKFLIYHIT